MAGIFHCSKAVAHAKIEAPNILVPEKANLLVRPFTAAKGEHARLLREPGHLLLLPCQLLLLLPLLLMPAGRLQPGLLRCISLSTFVCGGLSGSRLCVKFLLSSDGGRINLSCIAQG